MRPFRVMEGLGDEMIQHGAGCYTLADARDAIDEMVSRLLTTMLPRSFMITNRHDQVIEYREFSVQVKTTLGGADG